MTNILARLRRFLPASLALLTAVPASSALARRTFPHPDWVVVSGASYHFRQNERDWRQFNPGIGFEWKSQRYADLHWTGGYFLNSYDRHALYAGVRWMPWQLGPVQFGAYALAATGYPSPVLVLPGLSIAGRNIGLNVVAAPNISKYSGYVGIQLRFRLP